MAEGFPLFLDSISTKPANTSSLPFVTTLVFNEVVGLTVVKRTSLKSLRFALGYEDTKEAKAPVTWGVAIDVPLMD